MSLRDYQAKAVASVPEYFKRKPNGSPLICLPVGAGKSWVAAYLIKHWIETERLSGVLVLSHRREILRQDADKIRLAYPDASLGIYSASLSMKQLRPVTVAGIQSIYKAKWLPRFDRCLVDECHLISRDSNTMYRRLLSRLREQNPDFRLVGLTGTPWRLTSGHLCEGEDRIFEDICCDVPIRRLINAGYLVPFVSKVANTEADLSGVHVRGGEYVANEAQEAMDRRELIQGAVKEMITFGANRRSWLVFCAGVTHAEHVRDCLRENGIKAAAVFGHTPQGERDSLLRDFQEGRIQALSNCDVLGTGYDCPAIDLIALLRPSRSPGWYVQAVGRGSRLSPETGKTSCLVLDFVDVIRTLGCIDDVKAPSNKKRGSGSGVAPIKVCPTCNTVAPLGFKECRECGYQWPEQEIKHARVASTAPIMSAKEPSQPLTWSVTRILYRLHEKPGKPDSLRVRYVCGLNEVSEWVCFEHGMEMRFKAASWWRVFSRFDNGQIPKTTAEALSRTSELRQPATIRVVPDGKFYRIVGYSFGDAERRPAA